MAVHFSTRKTQRFHFLDNGEEESFVLIFGDELELKTGASFKGPGYSKAAYRGREGAIRNYSGAPDVGTERPVEMYFLDVGQGDAALIVTPNNTKILVDGGLRRTTTADFLIWKYRLDKSANRLVIDHLILSHADADHVTGLIPILQHPRISVHHIWHNGIALFASGHNQALGTITDGKLHGLHSSLADLAGADLTRTFRGWLDAVAASGASYQALDASHGVLDVGDASVRLEITGPVLNGDGTLNWLGSKSHSINGHSLTFRLVHNHVRALFSGDMNIQGAKHILAQPNAALGLDAHIFKSPHHGSHEYHQPYLDAVRPVVTVVSSGDSPDHGHPRASFLGAVGASGRGSRHLVFSTEIAATFTESGKQDTPPPPPPPEGMATHLFFATSQLNRDARKRFKKALPGIINVRSDGRRIYAARRVSASYQWESYDGIDVTGLS